MSSNRDPRIALTVGAAAGGLLAAAFLPMAVANADDYFYTPDPFQFLPEPGTEWGTMGLISGFTGVGDWDTGVFTNNTLTTVADSLSGKGSEINVLNIDGIPLTPLSFSIDNFTVSSNIDDPSGLAPGSFIDVINFAPIGNEFIDAAAGSTTPGLTDILLTSYGDFTLF
jgi:hypothetical protein